MGEDKEVRNTFLMVDKAAIPLMMVAEAVSLALSLNKSSCSCSNTGSCPRPALRTPDTLNFGLLHHFGRDRKTCGTG
jgi:hypothetical protein